MSDSRELTATLVGALLGAAAGYLFFTERGRRVRQQIEPALENLGRELSSFRATIENATGVASEGWKLVSETFSDTEPAPRYPGGQTSPF